MEKGVLSQETPDSTAITRGAAPSLPYTLGLVVFFGVALAVTAWLFPPQRYAKAIECDLPLEPDSLVISVAVRGKNVVAQCTYTRAGRK